jgi:hypothetical protein
VKLTIHLHLVQMSRVMELYLHSLIRIHGVVFNCAQGQFYFFGQSHVLSEIFITVIFVTSYIGNEILLLSIGDVTVYVTVSL